MAQHPAHCRIPLSNDVSALVPEALDAYIDLADRCLGDEAALPSEPVGRWCAIVAGELPADPAATLAEILDALTRLALANDQPLPAGADTWYAALADGGPGRGLVDVLDQLLASGQPATLVA
jgi:hypothetical protein